ncbi:MAG: S41 family peptidase [Burkholderiaceae bacterium]
MVNARVDGSGTRRASKGVLAALLAALIAGCGGGGGGESANNPPVGVQAQACSPNNPYRADATAATSIGSLATEKAWLRDYFDRQYLWYAEVPSVNAAAAIYSNENDVYTSLDNYFEALKTPATTASGARRDKFSFTYPTRAWDQLMNSGASLGYGIEWYFASATAPRGIRVAFVHVGSAAASAGILRGDTLVLADNVGADDNTPAGVATLNAALFPSSAATHTFRFSRNGAVFDRSLTAGTVTQTSVDHRVLAVGGSNVGYLLFNDHLLTAEQPLITAMQALKNANVTDLVLDLRYNGGGYVYIASELAYMIAGATPTTNMVFERTLFNDKRSAENDVTPFFNTACVPDAVTFACTSTAALPTLNLSRVYVLASGSTCSASEAVINGLRGVNIDVRLIGSTTCGKPYGFYGADNCGISYFPMEFRGVNAKGFGEYSDGFVPSAVGNAGAAVPGCNATDDLNHALGDPAEGQLAAALQLRGSGSCPVAAGRETPLALSRPALGVQRPIAMTQRYGRLPKR